MSYEKHVQRLMQNSEKGSTHDTIAIRLYQILKHNHEDISHKIDVFDALSLAVLKNQEVHFSYSDKQRVVRPYKLVNTNGIWYVLADEEGTLKTYSVSKLKNLDIKETVFTPQQSFLTSIKDNDSKWFSRESIEVVLDV